MLNPRLGFKNIRQLNWLATGLGVVLAIGSQAPRSAYADSVNAGELQSLVKQEAQLLEGARLPGIQRLKQDCRDILASINASGADDHDTASTVVLLMKDIKRAIPNPDPATRPIVELTAKIGDMYAANASFSETLALLGQVRALSLPQTSNRATRSGSAGSTASAIAAADGAAAAQSAAGN